MVHHVLFVVCKKSGNSYLSVKFMTKLAVLLTPVCVFTHPLLPLLSKFDFEVIVVWTNTIVYKCTVVTSLDKQN